MRSARNESLCEHSAETAFLAHILCSINNCIYGGNARGETVATAALYHDASEILTGDMPTPVKYKNEQLKAAYKKTEAEAARRIAQMLPPALREDMGGYITGEVLTDYEKMLLKAADRLSALIKCREELNGGNREFKGAAAQQTAALHEMNMPEAEYFIQNMLPCYDFTLDELAGKSEQE